MDFKIFTDRLTYVKNDTQAKESFTFYIERNNYSPASNTIENLILTKRFNEEEYKAYIITYFFPDGIASEHKNFNVTGFKAVNSETFSFNNVTFKSACENTYEYIVIETAHKCYSGNHSGASEAANCEGKGSLPYSTYQVVAYLTDSCGEGIAGGGQGGDQSGAGGGGSSTPGSGGSGPVDTGISLPPSCQSVDCEVPILANDINVLLGNKLNFEQLTFLFNNDNIATEVKNYLDQNTNAEAKKFGIWTINYFINNPSVTIEQFKNWFMGSSQGNDGTYDQVFWENPNLTFQQQVLPTFDSFKNACPSRYTNTQTLCNDIGGEVLAMYNSVAASGKKLNTCAIRISKALNYSGIVIPKLPDNANGTKNSIIGADGKNYIINAKALNIWMKKTFGTNQSNYQHYNATQGGDKGINFPTLLKNKKGIYTMVSRPEIQKDWGSGHADLLEDGQCLLDCHFYDVNNQFVPVGFIDLWILN